MILTSGQHFLQVIELKETSTDYRLEKRVHEEMEILTLQVLGKGGNGKGISMVTTT